MTHSVCAGGKWGGCGRAFVGVTQFDAHRVGEFTTRGKGKRPRRCMSEPELRAAGFSVVSSCVKAGQQMPLWGKEVAGHRPAARGGQKVRYEGQNDTSLWDEIAPPERGSAA